MIRSARALPVLTLLLLAAPAAPADEPARGAGRLLVTGPDGGPELAFPLRHTDVRVEIAGFVAHVRVTQVFESPLLEPAEAVYTFPLSQRAAVDAMSIRTGDREIRAEIRRREEARRIYEDARAHGQLAALLDQERPNIFTQSIANLMPGERVEVELHYVETLEFEAGQYAFAFPTVVGPRFVPGVERVPDAARILPPVAPEGVRAGHDFDVEVVLDAGVPIGEIESPLHEIVVERRGASRAVVRLARGGELPNRDFVLRYAVSGAAPTGGALVHRGEDGDGYASFVLLPPREVTRDSVAPRELVFVIDRSGSQSGLPLQKAKETLLWILDRLNPADTFQVVSFAGDADFLFERPESASPEMKRRAREYVQALRAGGGTWMAEAVRRICAQPADSHRLRIVIFMTDGYIGNDFEVIALVKELRDRSRWFPFGTGNATNRFLLEQMARQGGGEVDYVLLSDPGEKVAEKFWARIANPVVTDVRLDFEGLDVRDVLPTAPADVWAERPLIVHARYRRAGRGRVILSGYQGGRPYRHVVEVTLPARAPENRAIASIWARARVDELMSRDLRGLQTGSFSEELRERIVDVALAHSIVTQFTSFVAVDDGVVNPGGEQTRVVVPVELPQGVSREGIFGRSDAQAGLGSASFALHGRVRAQRRLQPGLLHLAKLSANEVADAPVPVPSTPLSSRARARLDPALLALLAGGSADALGIELERGEVRVEIELDPAVSNAREQLERLGLRIHSVTPRHVVGSIALSKLAALAEIDGVVKLAPA